MNKHQDFGNILYGAKKYQRGFITSEDVKSFGDLEIQEYANKKSLWLKPEITHEDKFVDYVAYSIWKCVKAKAPNKLLEKEYIKGVLLVKEIVEFAQTKEEALAVLEACYDISRKDHKLVFYRQPKPNNITEWQMQLDLFGVAKKDIPVEKAKLDYRLIKFNPDTMEIDHEKLAYKTTPYCTRYYYFTDVVKERHLIENSGFILHKSHIIAVNLSDAEYESFINIKAEKYKNEPAKTRKRSPRLTHKSLTKIEREGIDFLSGEDATTDKIQEYFKFYGGQFGNWLNDTDRQVTLNYAFNAFADLALALDISLEDIGQNNTLGIAFGARGSGNALAHYEQDKHVINLTKTKGAGCLAHEWGHSLDSYIARFNRKPDKFATQINYPKPLNKAMENIIDAFRHRSSPYFLNDFVGGSIKLDVHENRKKPYYSDIVEMFARAFSCYVIDKLAAQNMKNDYLAYEFSLEFEVNGKKYNANPQGEEREKIKVLFDNLFKELKKDGVFSDYNYNKEQRAAIK